MDILAKIFLGKFTKICNFMPNMAFSDSPIIPKNAPTAYCGKSIKETKSRSFKKI